MDPTRTDEILRGWKMASHAGRRPALAPAPVTNRSSLPLGVLAASAVVVLVLVVGSRLLSSGPGPTVPGVGASPAAPTASASASPTAAPFSAPPASASAAAPSPIPTISQAPAGSSSSGSPTIYEIDAARADIDSYTKRLKDGDPGGAWAMLAPEEQLKIGSYGAFKDERTAFFVGVKSFTVEPNPTDVAPIRSWLAGTNGATINLSNAVLVEVRYDFGRAATPADWDLYIVDRKPNGILEIFSVR